MNKRHIVLIGMPGSGKTTLGVKLSKLMNLPFVDTDSYIVTKTQKSVTEIFSGEGENRFREIEKHALEEIIGGAPSVISTGGGMPCFFNNMDIMNDNAVTVYLEVPPLNLCQYLQNDKKRPLVQGKTPEELKQYIYTSLENRKMFYDKADIKINPRFGSPSKIAVLLSESIRRFMSDNIFMIDGL